MSKKVVCFVLFLCVGSVQAWAYIDPGYGGYLISSAFATAAAFFALASAYIIYFFRRFVIGAVVYIWQKQRVNLVCLIIILAVPVMAYIGSHKSPSERSPDRFNPALSGAFMRDWQRASRGYNLYEGQLIDMDGRIIKRWSSVYMGTLDKNGDYYAQKYFQSSVWGRYTWDDKVIWEKHFPIHHHILLTPQGTLITCTKEMHEYKGRKIEFDVILEFDKDGHQWRRFSTWEHLLELQKCHDPLKFERPLQMIEHSDFKKSVWGGNFDYYHLNFVSLIPDNVLKDVDPAFKPGNWLLSCRHGDFLAIIDPQTGQILWHIARGDVQNGLQGAHATQMLPSGNILIFDNGTQRSWSRVIELNPRTKQIVWEYRNEGFFTYNEGYIQVLPNGNILVTVSEKGHVFEVTRDKKIVWEFYNPRRQNAAVSKTWFSDIGLDADVIFDKLIAHGLLKADSFSEGHLLGRVDEIKRSLKELFPDDFPEIYNLFKKYEDGKNREYREEIYRMHRYPPEMIEPFLRP